SSAFRGGFTQEAAETVCEAPEALEQLEHLRECSLVLAEEIADGRWQPAATESEGRPSTHDFQLTPDVGATEMRFRLLELLREYGAEQLKPEERATLMRRHALRDLAVRAKALHAAGVLARCQGDYSVAQALHDESLMIRRELGDRRDIADSLHGLGKLAHDRGDYGAAQSLFEESLAIRRALGDRTGI